MKRKVTYKCESCGREFDRYLSCVSHEHTCTDRTYFIEQTKKRLLNYISLIESKDLFVTIHYNSMTGTCNISVVPKR